MDGRAHGVATVALAACVAPVAPLVGTGALSGLLLDPDLDVDGWGGPAWRLKRLWTPLGWAWKSLWLPYALLMRHRGISHWPVVGTLTRLAYLSPLLALWARFGTVPWGAVGLWAAGLCLSDLLHIVMDGEGKWLSRWAS